MTELYVKDNINDVRQNISRQINNKLREMYDSAMQTILIENPQIIDQYKKIEIEIFAEQKPLFKKFDSNKFSEYLNKILNENEEIIVSKILFKYKEHIYYFITHKGNLIKYLVLEGKGSYHKYNSFDYFIPICYIDMLKIYVAILKSNICEQKQDIIINLLLPIYDCEVRIDNLMEKINDDTQKYLILTHLRSLNNNKTKERNTQDTEKVEIGKKRGSESDGDDYLLVDENSL